jgi:hypothetical protein
MFEEINQKLDRANRQIEKIGQYQPELSDNNENLELKSAIENLYDSQSQRLHAIENAIRTEKRKIEFTPTSTFGMAFLFSLMLMLLAMSIWNNSLRSLNASLSDNDLKFRYIQMQGNATAKELEELDSLFHFNKNSKKIKSLRKQVETFEKNVEERARILEQEERLKREKRIIEQNISLKK